MGKKFAEAIPHAQIHCQSYLNSNPSKNAFFMTPPDNEEIDKIISLFMPQRSNGFDNISMLLIKKVKKYNKKYP